MHAFEGWRHWPALLLAACLSGGTVAAAATQANAAPSRACNRSCLQGDSRDIAAAHVVMTLVGGDIVFSAEHAD